MICKMLMVFFGYSRKINGVKRAHSTALGSSTINLTIFLCSIYCHHQNVNLSTHGYQHPNFVLIHFRPETHDIIVLRQILQLIIFLKYSFSLIWICYCFDLFHFFS